MNKRFLSEKFIILLSIGLNWWVGELVGGWVSWWVGELVDWRFGVEKLRYGGLDFTIAVMVCHEVGSSSYRDAPLSFA